MTRSDAQLQFTTISSAQQRRSCDRSAPGFTLIEILFAISIFSLLAAVVTINMFGRVGERYLDEGSRQFETVLRMARAEASNQGRRMRIAWSGEEDRIIVLWEPQPLAQPGQFVEYTGSTWGSYLPNTTVRVTGTKRQGAEESDAMVFGTKQSASKDADAHQPIADFYPDGSSDAATIELASRDVDDDRRAVVELDGVNPLIASRIMGPSEYAQWNEQAKVLPMGRTNAN